MNYKDQSIEGIYHKKKFWIDLRYYLCLCFICIIVDFWGSFTHFKTNELLNSWLTFSFSLFPMLDPSPICWVETLEPSNILWEYCCEADSAFDCSKADPEKLLVCSWGREIASGSIGGWEYSCCDTFWG